MSLGPLWYFRHSAPSTHFSPDPSGNSTISYDMRNDGNFAETCSVQCQIVSAVLALLRASCKTPELDSIARFHYTLSNCSVLVLCSCSQGSLRLFCFRVPTVPFPLTSWHWVVILCNPGVSGLSGAPLLPPTTLSLDLSPKKGSQLQQQRE